MWTFSKEVQTKTKSNNKAYKKYIVVYKDIFLSKAGNSGSWFSGSEPIS
jgi:hypothetical protein